jgi:hypothetical protein
MKIIGSTEYLNHIEYEAELVVDTSCPDTFIWITTPYFQNHMGPHPFEEIVKVIASPRNSLEAEKIVSKHNELRNSPLAKALNEKK